MPPGEEAGLRLEDVAEFAYYWVKTATVTGVPLRWDGGAWVAFTDAFPVGPDCFLSVGIIREGGGFTSVHGGRWPESFAPWEMGSHQAKLDGWADGIAQRWSAKVNLRRADCQGVRQNCCVFSVAVEASFREVPEYSPGALVLVEGDGTSSGALLFLEQSSVVPSHALGRILGNSDEYPGGDVDESVTGDGATNGVDESGVMGSQDGTVRKRHLGRVAEEFTTAVGGVDADRGSYVAEYAQESQEREP
jgi:hypothetical protein